MCLIKYKSKYYQFKPTLLGWIVTLICIPIFIKFGLWQYGKAQKKIEIQEAYQASDNSVLTFPVDVLEVKEADKSRWQYKKVEVKGVYQPEYGFLLDNQVEHMRAGYHVITPLKIDQTEHYVLVNRGWIPGNHVHTDVPEVETPETVVQLEGQVWIPSKNYFTLEEQTEVTTFKAVWQNMDIGKYKKQVPIEVSALAIKLDPESKAGGFVRNWQVPVDRIATHLSYAYQWFGFAIATLLIFLYMSFKAVTRKQ